ncbi:MAG TPA: LptF/LptG family permease, partial [Bacteroidales bacterium]|nr:LptF/LptG family permease [Bacteroidales bacterium]
MKKVDRFIFKSFLGPLAMTFFIVLVIFILQFLWMYVDDLAGKGLPIKVLAELLLQFSLTFVPVSLPLAILLASLMTFGNMGEYMELTALKASGIPLRRLMMPMLVFVTLLSIGSFMFADYILPISNRKARTLLYDIKRKRPEVSIQAGTFCDDIDGFSIKITHKDPVTSRLDKLFIYDHRKAKANTSVITADSGYMRISPDETAMILTLYNGYAYTEMADKGATEQEKKYPFRRDKFGKQTLVVALQGFDLKRSDM